MSFSHVLPCQIKIFFYYFNIFNIYQLLLIYGLKSGMISFFLLKQQIGQSFLKVLFALKTDRVVISQLGFCFYKCNTNFLLHSRNFELDFSVALKWFYSTKNKVQAPHSLGVWACVYKYRKMRHSCRCLIVYLDMFCEDL